MPEEFFIETPTPTDTVLDGFRTYQDTAGRLLRWSADFDLPHVGQEVYITMNGIGPAVVRGYFVSSGDAAGTEWYVGVMTRAINPPEWLRKQNQEGAKRTDRPQWWRDGIGCEFGTEIRLSPEDRVAAALREMDAIAKRYGAVDIDVSK